MFAAPPVGVVLAGGVGRRMGGRKTTVEFRGEPLLWRPVRALRAVLADVAVICKEDTILPELPGGVRIWCEPDARHHPLIGVAAALRGAAGRAVVVCAGDLPFVTAGTVRALAGSEPEAAAVVARAAGRLQPLLARYGPNALGTIDAMGPGEAATAVVERLGPAILDVADREAFNVNAPEDLLLAEAEPPARGG